MNPRKDQFNPMFLLLLLGCVSFAQGACEVYVYTSWDWYSGTDAAEVYVTLYGTKGEVTLSASANEEDAFKRGTVYTFSVDKQDYAGVVHSITVGLDNGGQFAQWRLNKIEVNDTVRGEEYEFTCRCLIEGFDRPHRNLTRIVDGGWSTYGNWSTCSKSCEGGTHARTRSCDDPPPMYGGAPCQGEDLEKGTCNTQPCPIDGGWGNWTAWSSCPVTCGEGNQTRTRLCDNPAPQYGGKPCEGQARMMQPCKMDTPCPVHGGWGEFGTWGNCSEDCGGGEQTRERACDNPAPMYGGDPCRGNSTEKRECNSHPCPINGGWGNWTDWGTCSASCDGGNQSRSRVCDSPAPQHGGKDCEGEALEMTACNTDIPCPVDGGWSVWSEYSACSRTCEGGSQFKTRACDNPAPAHGGKDCEGNTTEHRDCGQLPCPDPCTLPHIKQKGFYADAHNCRTYYMCLHGTSLPKCCPAGLGWDDVTRSCSVRTCADECDNPTMSTSRYTTPVTTTTLSPDVCVTANGVVKRKIAGQPSKYGVKMGHAFVTLTCPNGKMAPDIFSLEECACVTDTEATLPPDMCSPGTGVQYQLHESEATQYYMLWAGQRLLVACPPGHGTFSLTACRCVI